MTACNRRAADFVVSTLLAGPAPFLPSVDGEAGEALFLTRAAELAAIEVRIAEQMLDRWSLMHRDLEAAKTAATTHLWTRLSQIRETARQWMSDHAARLAEQSANGSAGQAPAFDTYRSYGMTMAGVKDLTAALPVPGSPSVHTVPTAEEHRELMRGGARPVSRPPPLVLTEPRKFNAG